MAVRTQPDALKVFAAIAMIVNSREDSAKVKLTSVARKTEKEEKRSAGNDKAFGIACRLPKAIR